MLTLDEIRNESGIQNVTKNMNTHIILDARLFNTLLKNDICNDFYNHRRQYDFDIYLADYNGMILQRPYVWELFQQKEFIMSMLLKKPIDDVIAVCHLNEDESEIIQIIDGKQRLLTIYKFLHNEFPITVNGKDFYWKDFDKSLQSYFCTRVNCITGNVYYSDYIDPITDKEKIILFNYYNFSGTPQTEEHKEKLQNLLKQ